MKNFKFLILICLSAVAFSDLAIANHHMATCTTSWDNQKAHQNTSVPGLEAYIYIMNDNSAEAWVENSDFKRDTEVFSQIYFSNSAYGGPTTSITQMKLSDFSSAGHFGGNGFQLILGPEFHRVNQAKDRRFFHANYSIQLLHAQSVFGISARSMAGSLECEFGLK